MRALQGWAGFMAVVYATLAQGAAPAPAPKPDLERGKQIASTICVACHMADGNSVVPTNPILAGQHADYIAAQLAAYKAGTRANPIMAGMAAALTPDDMRNVGAWFAQQVPKAPAAAKDKALAAAIAPGKRPGPTSSSISSPTTTQSGGTRPWISPLNFIRAQLVYEIKLFKKYWLYLSHSNRMGLFYLF